MPVWGPFCEPTAGTMFIFLMMRFSRRGLGRQEICNHRVLLATLSLSDLILCFVATQWQVVVYVVVDYC